MCARNVKLHQAKDMKAKSTENNQKTSPRSSVKTTLKADGDNTLGQHKDSEHRISPKKRTMIEFYQPENMLKTKLRQGNKKLRTKKKTKSRKTKRKEKTESWITVKRQRMNKETLKNSTPKFAYLTISTR